MMSFFELRKNLRKSSFFSITAIFVFLAAFYFGNNAQSAVLTNNELTPDSYGEIAGEGFGALSDGSFICFTVNTKCFSKESFATLKGFAWSDAKITFGVPGDIPLNGSVIVYNSGKRSVCTGSMCTIQEGVKELARLSYRIKPVIRGVNPLVWERDTTVTIKGAGFGDAIGSVLFDDLNASVTRWSDRELIVRAPNSSLTKRVSVQSSSGARVAIDLFSYLDDVSAPQSWAFAGNGAVVVAIIDDGLYLNHPNIKSSVWKNQKEIPGNKKDDDGNGYVDDVYGYNFAADTASVDPNGIHGTHVASIVLTTAHGGMAGAQSNIIILPLVVADSKGVIASRESVIKAIRYAADNGADIINASFGSGGTLGYAHEFDEAIRYAFNRGSIVIAAAGNDDRLSKDGTDLSIVPQSPVCNTSGRLTLIGVAALDNSDSAHNGKARARWSSYGKNCIQLSAPGVRIPGAIPPQYSSDNTSYYTMESGTSFAAPIVSGVAAMMKATFPSLPHWEIMNKLIASADSVEEQNRGFGDAVGSRVNAYRALSGMVLRPAIKGVTPILIAPGENVVLGISQLSSAYQLKLVSSTSAIPIDFSGIKPLAADTFEVHIPSDTPDGLYHFSVYIPSLISSVTGESEFTVRRQSGNAHIQTNEQPPPISTHAEIQPIRFEPEPKSWLEREEELSLKPNLAMVNRTKGRILLQVEEQGQAWYVNPTNGKRYYLKDGTAAFEILRRLGIGIRSSDLSNISVEGSKAFSFGLATKLKGRILLQVEEQGQAWYVNPTNEKRYYLKNGDEAYRIMRALGLGISTTAIRTIPIGK